MGPSRYGNSTSVDIYLYNHSFFNKHRIELHYSSGFFHNLVYTNAERKREKEGIITMRISVVVPVYNEEKTVARVLEQLSQVPLDLEVVVVDDASTDRTWEILQEVRQQAPFNTYRYVRQKQKHSTGAGPLTGFRMVSGDLVTAEDAHMEYDTQAM